MEGAAAFVRMEQERDQLRTDLERATKRVTELEQKLQTHADMEKSLGEAREREQARDDLEKTQVDRLLALADVIGSKYFGSLPTLPFVDF